MNFRYVVRKMVAEDMTFTRCVVCSELWNRVWSGVECVAGYGIGYGGSGVWNNV